MHQVETAEAPIGRFRPLVDGDVWTRLDGTMSHLAAALRTRTVWNVNSTAQGGGVAELLGALVPYSRGCGIDERWVVIEGDPEFFGVTKTLHNFLHGVRPEGATLTDGDRKRYERATAANLAALADQVGPRDVAILHDPQTAGLIPGLRERGVRVVWRSHIGVDEPNEVAREAWTFLLPYVRQADAVVFSRREYAWDGLEQSRVEIIAPCIDPFAPKNRELGEDEAAAHLSRAGVSDLAPFVLQVSRWDRLKDPIGVMRAFAEHVAPRVEGCFVLAGPEADSVKDDPEQPEVLHEVLEVHLGLPATVRERVVVAQLPMDDGDENALMVNAMQRRAEVVVQKSLAEGFGLTVAEAMWKSKPVVASRVGGIGDQVEHGKSGMLVDNPRDLGAFGEAVVGLLCDGERTSSLGAEARKRVVDLFITPCHLIAQGDLIADLVSH